MKMVEGTTVVQLVELLHHSARNPGLILTSGVLCLKFARTPCNSIGILWMLQLAPTSQGCAG